MHDSDHLVEIDRVLNGVDTGRDSLVTASWQRCIESYGMDPSRREPAHILSQNEFREHREQAERLIATARSGLQSLFDQVAGQNYVLLLADDKGVCVDFFGDRSFEDDLRAAGLYTGYKWTEELAGTNGVGSCLVTQQPVTIHQGDHFSLAHTPLSCTAAPIFDTKGTLAAVLDVSLLRGPSPKSSQNLAMTLVTNSTRRVELANLMAATRRDWVLRFSVSPEFLEVDPEAAVALDGSGRIVGMTSGAQRLLSPEGGGKLIGSRLEDWLEMSVDDLPDFMRGRPSEQRILRMTDGRALYGHAIAPQTPGMVSMLRRRKAELPGALGSFAGPDASLHTLLAKSAQLASTNVPLLISGETGTGKEKLARAIYLADPRAGGFQSVRCGGLVDCEPFLDADARTLFLRGIEDLTPQSQTGLLSVLEKRPELRVIASCRCAPSALADVLRTDLLHRLVGATLALPPIRNRADLDWLIDRVLRRCSSDDILLSPLARAELKSRPWAGNIRELEHVLESAVALCEGTCLDIADIPPPALLLPSEQQAAGTAELEALLTACDWNMSEVARRLGLNRSTILRRMRKAGLAAPY
ncbi:sigma-54-dependent Fis family transcriptional regulator [Tateyamaria omphalii]|uniref:Transcriptional regulator n=1 Tax=Tateyamaria omphalii TaxID=299262 RepID=A0A1P8MRG8_9RHOB|nr:sigma-54-dependent Fis family transcriptional regulator [Tateyamaria omphalii]APX10670.1 transcriptional regulator [Tateyamaria omphalii]